MSQALARLEGVRPRVDERVGPLIADAPPVLQRLSVPPVPVIPAVPVPAPAPSPIPAPSPVSVLPPQSLNLSPKRRRPSPVKGPPISLGVPSGPVPNAVQGLGHVDQRRQAMKQQEHISELKRQLLAIDAELQMVEPTPSFAPSPSPNVLPPHGRTSIASSSPGGYWDRLQELIGTQGATPHPGSPRGIL
eukprot:Hpha_TRINITY_DN14240_c0_g2::TRINITY_DN14240_c0_g2_i1::g.22469::m.22469